MLSLAISSLVQAQSVSMGVLPGAEWISIGSRNDNSGMISSSNSTYHYFTIYNDEAVVVKQTWRTNYRDGLVYYEEDQLIIKVNSFISITNIGGNTGFRQPPYLCSVGWEESFDQWNKTGALLEKVGIIFYSIEYIYVNVTIRDYDNVWNKIVTGAYVFKIGYENTTYYEQFTYLKNYGIQFSHSWNMIDEWGKIELKTLKLCTREPYIPLPINPIMNIIIVTAIGSIIVVVILIYIKLHDSSREQEMVDVALQYRYEDDDEEW